MENQVDSYRFITGITKRMVKTWVGMEKPHEIPWTPLTKKLSDCTVATIVTAGMALKSDKPFDQDGERAIHGGAIPPTGSYPVQRQNRMSASIICISIPSMPYRI